LSPNDDRVSIDSRESAKQYIDRTGNHDPMKQDRLGPTGTPVQPLTDPGQVAAAGGSDIEVDLDQLRTAVAQFQQQYGNLAGTVEGAATLADHLPNGTGPTARMMGELYRSRTGTGTDGVRGALSGHMQVIGKLVDNLVTTIDNYVAAEQAALNQIHEQPLANTAGGDGPGPASNDTEVVA
jgi:hypothetical protein